MQIIPKLTLAVGDLLGNRWKVHGIKRGGLGVVYLVTDHDGHPYVAKTFQRDKLEDQPEWRKRFLQECACWLGVTPHPNVITALMVRRYAGQPYVIMELAEGCLADLIGKRNFLSDPRRILELALQFCDGLNHAYREGIVAHRDIKPANCLLTSEGKLKISDFGLARAIQLGSDNTATKSDSLESASEASRKTPQAQRERLTSMGSGIGSQPYMPPEQFEDFASVDVRGDVYSFGIMLFEMITGHLPFKPGEVNFYLLHKCAPIPELDSRLCPAWPPNSISELNAFLSRCLAKNRMDRFPDFHEARATLARIYENITSTTAPPPVKPSQPTLKNLVMRGASFGWLEEWDKATSALLRALEIDPNNSNAEHELATIYYLKGDQNTAQQHFQRAISLDPSSSMTWTHYAASLERNDKASAAMTACDQALALNERNDTALALKGKFLLKRGDYTQARDLLSRAIELYFFEPRYHDYLARTCERLGNRAGQELCRKNCVALDPFSSNRWYDLGVLFSGSNRAHEAIECYERAVSLEPKNWRAWANLGADLVAIQQASKALSCLDKALELHPADDVSWFMKGEILFAFLKDYKQALACYKRAQELGRAVPPDRIASCEARSGRT